MNYQGSTCICRVPKAQLRSGTVVECTHCGKRSIRSNGGDSRADFFSDTEVVAGVPLIHKRSGHGAVARGYQGECNDTYQALGNVARVKSTDY